MFIRWLICALIATSCLLAENPCNFDPNFGGTLLEYPATVIDPGQVVFEFYSFAGPYYGVYDNSWNLLSRGDYTLIIPQIFLYFGITKNLQLNTYVSSQTVLKDHHSKTSLNDSSIGLQYQFLWEGPDHTHPNMSLIAIATFPTGKYKWLNAAFDGADASGSGAYQAGLVFVVSKNFYNIPCHPYKLSLNLNYNYATPVHVEGRNTYGGGPLTKGTVHPKGNIFADFSIEYAFSKNFDLTIDLIYTHYLSPSFEGFLGLNPDGTLAAILSKSRDLIYATSALEIHCSESAFLYLGGCFSLLGRNNTAFAEGTLSFFYTF